MVDILNQKDDIVNFLFYLNLIALVVGIFVSSKTYFMTIICLDVVFSGTLKVISKFSHVFNPKTKMFGPLGNLLDMANNMGQK